MVLVRRLMMMLLAGYWGMICVLTHISQIPPVGQQMGDKTAHFAAYAVLAGMLCITMWLWRPTLRLVPVLALDIALAYGMLDEWTQPFFGRTCDFRDWLFDAGGAALAVAALGMGRWLIVRRGGAVAAGAGASA